MVRLATPKSESNSEPNETAPVTALPEHSPTVQLDAAFETALERLVGNAVAKQIARITETAVTRALTALDRRSHAVEDDTAISELPLPAHVVSSLHRRGVFTVGQLTDSSREAVATRLPDAHLLSELLTNRELEVFRLVGKGHNSREIAQLLGLAESTVETHRARIKDKLRLRNAAEFYSRASRWVHENEA